MLKQTDKGKIEEKSQSGFSLLETLTALTILAISMAALFGNFSGSLKGAGRSIDATDARIIAQSIMAENVADSTFRVGQQSGQYKRYQWSISIFPVSGELSQTRNQGGWKLYKIQVDVRQGRANLFQLSRIKLGKGI